MTGPAGSGPSGATSVTGGTNGYVAPSGASQELSDTGLRQVAGAYFEEVAVGSIAPNPRQPRRTFAIGTSHEYHERRAY